MSERACEWCGGGMGDRSPNAVVCSNQCREQRKSFLRYGQGRKALGPPAPRECAYCGKVFAAFDPKRLYCEPKGKCGQKAYRESDAGRAYFGSQEVKQRRREASRRYSVTPHGKSAQKERDAAPHNVARRRQWAQSEHGMQVKREYQRRRAAEAAIALLILPIEEAGE